MKDVDRERMHFCYGWCTPLMMTQYARFQQEPWYRWWHLLKNVPVEWVRQDAQRAAKTFVDILVVLLVLWWIL